MTSEPLRSPSSRRHRAPVARGGSGFTLIELIVTILIAALMLTIAAPSFVTFQRNSQLTAATNTFVAALAAARAEAMKRQLNTFVKPGNGTQTDWTLGWTVFVDGDWDNAPGGTADVAVLAPTALPTAVRVSSDGTGGYVMFNGAGFVQLTSGSTPAGALYLQFTNGTEQRNVLICPTGRIRACKPDGTTCTTSAC